MPIAGKATPIEILLVEDNPHDVVLTREAISATKLWNRLSVAEDGEQAIAYLRREGKHADAVRPDLILLDLNLPNIDGKELLQMIREDPSLRDIAVAVLTTSEDDEDIIRTYQLHANCYIIKPLGLREFEKVVQSIENFWFAVVRPSGSADGVLSSTSSQKSASE